MKATINGIEVEGTPQEIAECIKILEVVNFKPLESQPVEDSWQTMPRSKTDQQVTTVLLKKYASNNTKPRCPNHGSACYCTGACTGNGETTLGYELKKAANELMNYEYPPDHPLMKLYRGDHSGTVFSRIIR